MSPKFLALTRSSVWPYAVAIAVVVVCTAINELLQGRTHDEVRVMVYLLGLLPVTLIGNRKASALATVMSVMAFDFFFTRPPYAFTVYDPGYYFTFLVMALVGLTLGELTARLAAALEASRESARELARANEDLKALDRLKADLLSNVGHEFRTPLAAIAGNVELLQDEVAGPLSADQQAMMGQIQQGTDRLAHMVDYLLDFAQLDAGTFTFEMDQVDFTSLMREVASVFQPRAEAAGLTFELRLPDMPVPVEMDARRIAQVVGNLIDNAIKFTPAGGRVITELGFDDDSATVQVRDTGIGIAPEHLPNLFGKFYQVDPTSTRTTGGTGLGLAFSKALVEAHGGRIGVLSAEGRGSTFWFTLPRSQSARQAALTARAAPARPTARLPE
jgi:signal transduction histidine kinase